MTSATRSTEHVLEHVLAHVLGQPAIATSTMHVPVYLVHVLFIEGGDRNLASATIAVRVMDNLVRSGGDSAHSHHPLRRSGSADPLGVLSIVARFSVPGLCDYRHEIGARGSGLDRRQEHQERRTCQPIRRSDVIASDRQPNRATPPTRVRFTVPGEGV